MAVRKKQIREIVESLLDQHRVRQAPVPVKKLVRAFDIQIKLDEVDDELSGFLFRDRRAGRTVIGVNNSQHPNRQRFTIAHELGHYVLHEGETVHLDHTRNAVAINLRNSESATGENDDEREANLFAAELLMPARFLENDLLGKDLDLLGEEDRLLEDLAKKYKVSTRALTFRLSNLGYIGL